MNHDPAKPSEGRVAIVSAGQGDALRRPSRARRGSRRRHRGQSRRKEERKLATWTDEQAITNVAVVHPKLDKEVRKITLPGNVEAFYAASIHGQVSGYVQNWKYDIGAKVKPATCWPPSTRPRSTSA